MAAVEVAGPNETTYIMESFLGVFMPYLSIHQGLAFEAAGSTTQSQYQTPGYCMVSCMNSHFSSLSHVWFSWQTAKNSPKRIR